MPATNHWKFCFELFRGLTVFFLHCLHWEQSSAGGSLKRSKKYYDPFNSTQLSAPRKFIRKSWGSSNISCCDPIIPCRRSNTLTARDQGSRFQPLKLPNNFYFFILIVFGSLPIFFLPVFNIYLLTLFNNFCLYFPSLCWHRVTVGRVQPIRRAEGLSVTVEYCVVAYWPTSVNTYWRGWLRWPSGGVWGYLVGGVRFSHTHPPSCS